MTSFSGNSVENQGGGAFITGIASLNAVTFTNNLARYGGGLILYGNANVTGTAFLSNTATSWGGGAMFYRPTTLTNTTFLSNTAGEQGGGLWVNGSTFGPTAVVNSLFADNRVLTNRGDAVYMLGQGGADSRLALLHNTVTNQSLEDGPAIQVISGTVGMTNTIVSNQAIAIERVDGIVSQDFNLFANVTTPISGTVTGGGNSISGTAAFVDAANGDYQLTALSDAINAGTDAGITTDFFGDVRPQQGGFDIGFDESPFAPRYPDLGIVKTVQPLTAQPGAPVTYTLTFTNSGDRSALGVVISDSVPLSVTSVSDQWAVDSGVTISRTGSAPNLAWTVNDLPAGAGGVITLTGVLSSSFNLYGTAIDNTATITASNEITPAGNTSRVTLQVVSAPPTATPTVHADTLLRRRNSCSGLGAVQDDTDRHAQSSNSVFVAV
jgi:uncharacterized repeat protein (TIGR01451 family)